jgi:putative membrane protein
MMFWYGSHVAFWQLCVMWLGMIAFWALVAWAVYALVRGATRGSGGPTGQPPTDARHILDARLARGEIEVDEYQRLRDAMTTDEQHTAVGSAR